MRDVMQLRICVLLGALESSKDCELYDVLTMYTALKIYKHSYSNSTLGIYMFSYIWYLEFKSIRHCGGLEYFV